MYNIFEEQKIIDIIYILSVNKAIGSDCISLKMLKLTKLAISKPLCLLFYKSLEENTFPEFWTLAHVIPLFKKDDPSVASTYRPVSLLSCISKVMERIIFKYMYNFLHCNDLFYKAGFLPGNSTVCQLIEMYHNIVKSFDEENPVVLFFCDLFKAFDRVWHKVLLFKLETYGISGGHLDRLNSNLCNRTQNT